MRYAAAMAAAVGLAGFLGCGAQQLGGSPQRDGGDGNCPPLGKMVCAPAVPGCSSPAPICVNGNWACPANAGYSETCLPLCDLPLPAGCGCDPSTGAITCRDACPPGAPDGSIIACVGSCSDDTALSPICADGVWSCPTGTFDLTTCADTRPDAGTACPGYGQDGGVQSLACVSTCGSDTGLRPVCVSGAWQCPTGTFSPTECPRYCSPSPPPPGCMCNPMNGFLTCESDAGAGGHGG